MRRVTTAVVIVSAVVASQVIAQAQDATGARALFYNPATGTVRTTPAGTPSPAADKERANKEQPRPAAAPVVGVRYWLDLDGVGPVADTRTFHTGERIRLNVQSNCDGYLSIWTVGRDKSPKLLIPANASAGAFPLKQTAPFVSSPIRFSEPASDERLILFFARQRANLPSLETLQGEGALAAFLGIGARDLSIEVEEATPGQVGTYVVNRLGGPISRDVVLRHTTSAIKQ